MNTAGDAESALPAIERELAGMARALDDGCDVAPARRARLEGAIAIAIDTGWIRVDALRERARTLLGQDALVIEAGPDGCNVQLMVWQRRAPVRPSTPD